MKEKKMKEEKPMNLYQFDIVIKATTKFHEDLQKAFEKAVKGGGKVLYYTSEQSEYNILIEKYEKEWKALESAVFARYLEQHNLKELEVQAHKTDTYEFRKEMVIQRLKELDEEITKIEIKKGGTKWTKKT
jgi:hypothetical protein